MKLSKLLNRCYQGVLPLSLSAFFIIGLVAPFTFLTPKHINKVVYVKVEVDKEPVALPVVIPVTVIEQPLHSVDLPNFSSIKDIKTKKQTFFEFLLPAVIEQNDKILQQRAFIYEMKDTLSSGNIVRVEDEITIKFLLQKYLPTGSEIKIDHLSLTNLLLRIDIVPTPLVLAQAANESAWGTSRFARIGLNFFGIWCFRQGCGMVPGGRNTGAKHEVAAFMSVQAAVKGYLYNINTHRAYHVFRTIRAQLRVLEQPLYSNVLATGLLPYSERGSDYVVEINNMLRHNRRYFADFEPVVAPNPKPFLYADEIPHKDVVQFTHSALDTGIPINASINTEVSKNTGSNNL